jgi:hypothetical protein
MAPLTVLVALEIEMPSTVSEALVPAAAWVNPKPDVPVVTAKFAVLPGELATIAKREPVASVTTRAVTPTLSVLIWAATCESVWVPSAVTVVDAPLPVVMVKLPAGNEVELLVNTPEVQEAVVARLFTTTT